MSLIHIKDMTDIRRRSAVALLVAAALSGTNFLSAQKPAAKEDLKKEITVAHQENLKKEITVKHHEEINPSDAVRLNINPTVVMPPLPVSKLTYGLRQIRVGVPASIPSLAPAAYADTIYRSPYRGYAAAGYLPMINMGAAAGYKFIDNDRVRLNGWMQYDGSSYRGDLPWQPENADPKESVRLRRNVATVGGALHSAVGRDSYLDLGVDYTFARFNTPYYEGMRNQNVHRLNVQGLWSMTTGIWNCGIGANYGLFGYGNAVALSSPEQPTPPTSGSLLLKDSPYDPVRENHLSARLFASAKVWGADLAGIEVDFSHLSYGRHAGALMSATDIYNVEVFEPLGSLSHSLLSVRPFYRFNWKNLVLDLGANLDFTFNCGKVFHVAPEAQATWRPSQFVALYVKANGGVRQNTLGSLFDVTYYGLPNLAYSNSHVPLAGEVGVTIGLWRGFYSEISAAYAIADDWLMPVTLNDRYVAFETLDMKGYRFHAGFGYQYRNLLDASVSFEMAPQKHDRGFYLWRDRAKRVAEAKLRVTPIEPLDIKLGWNYRGSRRTFGASMFAPDPTRDGLQEMSLGSVNSLSVGALYRLTPQLSIFANVENLLNHRHILVGALPSEGIGGLAGVSYKF